MTIEITVRLFASLRQEAGWSEKRIGVPVGTTIRDVLDILDNQEEGVHTQGRAVYAAVNREYANTERVLAMDDEVAFFPPVSGGGTQPRTVARAICGI